MGNGILETLSSVFKKLATYLAGVYTGYLKANQHRAKEAEEVALKNAEAWRNRPRDRDTLIDRLRERSKRD